MKEFLAATTYIDWQHPTILAKAHKLADSYKNDQEIAKNCFLFVRDQIRHSLDFKLNPVTCKASEVLKYNTGYCYAKSHLLAALLRANKIPSGLCYQRLTIKDDIPPFCLHGLNAVYLKDYGWYRCDARGNKNGVNADFIPSVEQLAFPICIAGEADLPEIWSEPLPAIIHTLNTYKTYDMVLQNLPDITLLQNVIVKSIIKFDY